MNSNQLMDQQKQQPNRYAHLVTNSATGYGGAGTTTTTVSRAYNPELSRKVVAGNPSPIANTKSSPNGKAPPLGQQGANRQAYANQYYNSFSGLDWRQQWILFKERLLEKASEPSNQRKLILFIVCCALLLDNMLYMVIVPIIPDYLRYIGAWSTYTENGMWIRRNTSSSPSSVAGLGRHRMRLPEPSPADKWERVGGQVVYEGEDSAVGFLFASKAIVQLFINPFSGAIIDRIGYELPMMIGLAVMFFSTMVFACGQTYSVLFLARSLQGVGSAFADTSGMAMIADRFTEENERQKALGIAIAFISFGSLVAPPFGAVLYQAAGKEVPFIILSLVCLLDGSLLLLVTPPGTFAQLLPGYRGPALATSTTAQPTQVVSHSPPEPKAAPLERSLSNRQDSLLTQAGEDTQQRRQALLKRQKSISRRQSMTVALDGEAPVGTPIYVLFRDPYIACCAGALVVANVSLAFLEPTISIWMQNTMADIEEWQIGMIWLPAFVPHVLGVFATVKLADKYPRYQWVIAAIGLVLEGLSCLMVPFCSSFWSLIIPISIICFGLALIDTAILPTLGFLVDTRYVSVYGSIYAIADISYSLSYAIGPIIAGGIVEAIGFTALNFLIAVVTLGYTPVLAMLRSIRDYQPFAADLAGDQASRDVKSPFGRFGRKPLDTDEDEDQDDDDARYYQDNQPASRSMYESPRWANQASVAEASGASKPAPLAKKSSMRQPSGASAGVAGQPESGKRQSVKIVDKAEEGEQAGSNELASDRYDQQATSLNPFLGHN